jgi:hypothetical protein
MLAVSTPVATPRAAKHQHQPFRAALIAELVKLLAQMAVRY